MSHCIPWQMGTQEATIDTILSERNNFAVETSDERFLEGLGTLLNDGFGRDEVLPENLFDFLPPDQSNNYIDNDMLLTALWPVDLGEPVSNCPVQSSSMGSVDLSRSLLMQETLPVIRAETASRKRKKTDKKEILLSDSVAVGPTIRQSLKLEIVHPLEKNYRLRYKSDYFAQNGVKRKPRYVADRLNNHFITLKMPKNIRGQIRIDWLTIPDADGKQYSMPYKFQADNESMNTPDCNPHYVNIDADPSGTMKVYLVLIKSKQDSLRHQQPLVPFRPIYDSFNDPKKSIEEIFIPLTPKKLIEKYQLQKSVLAFTLCPFGQDGVTPIAEWQTTAMSTVLSEENNAEEESKACVTCPNCSTNFPVSSESIDEGNDQETNVKQKRTVGAKVNSAKKKPRTFQVLAEP